MRTSLVFIAFVGLFGCGEDGSDGARGSGGAGAAASGGAAGTATGGAAGAGTGGAAGSGTGGGVGALLPPVIDQVLPMAPGGLHVTWTNAQADCDEIEGERKTSSEDFKVVFKVPGSADNKHDGTPTAGVVNTYRVRCRKGVEYSAYSNEQSGTP